MKDLRVALIQPDLIWHNPSENRSRLEEKLVFSQEAKPDLVVLPEMFTTGFSMDTSQAETHLTNSCKWLQMVAERLEACVLGSVMTKDGAHFYNRLYVARPNQPIIWYDKRHLFRMANEQNFFEPGKKKVIFEYKGWRICPLICYDLRFPVFSRNTPLAYDLLVYIASWPARRALAWNNLLPARAIENLAYVVGVNRVGIDGNGHGYQGDSQAIQYDGQILAMLGAEETTQVIELSGLDLAHYRAQFPAWQDADSFEMG
jgi:predicted amidohydrolase